MSERENMSKKKIIGIILFVVLFVGMGVFSFFRNGERQEAKQNEKKEETKETVKEEKKEDRITYENLEGLFFLNEDGTEVFKNTFEGWLENEGIKVSFVQVSGQIITKDNVEIQDATYTFYLICDNGKYSVECVYQSGTYTFKFVEAVPLQELEMRPTEQTQTEQKKEVEEIQKNYKGTPEGEDLGSVVILNMDSLPQGVEEEKLLTDMTAFLEEQEEYRREVYFKEETEEGYYFSFKNKRQDERGLFVTEKDGGYGVKLVKGR